MNGMINMNLTQLKTFIAIVRYQSFSRAAAELNLTQPAVSKQVQALENSYGCPLLTRAGREAEPTEEGKILYQYALEVLRLLAEARTAIEKVGGTIRGPVYLGASTIPGHYVLPYLIGPFQQLYPHVELHVEIADTEQIVRRVLEGKVDFGVVGRQAESQLKYFPFMEDELVVIMPPGHPLAARDEIRAWDLVGQPLVWREQGSGTRKVLEERLVEAGVDTGLLQKKTLEVGSTEAVVAAVEAGLGLSLVSRWAVIKTASLGLIVTKTLADVCLKRDLFIARSKRDTSRAAAALMGFLQGPEVDAALTHWHGQIFLKKLNGGIEVKEGN